VGLREYMIRNGKTRFILETVFGVMVKLLFLMVHRVKIKPILD
jgi:hypothetical protein